MRTPNILTIAGSDSGGGAGIQADLKTIMALDGYGMSVITALTAQNGLGVTGIHAPEPEFVVLQLRAVLDGFPVHAAKTGMLFSAEIVSAVAACMARHELPLVVDPVMVSTSGSMLLKEDAVEALKNELFPLADWITPNLPEAELLLGRKLKGEADYIDAARECHERWGAAVLLKSGHAPAGRFANDFICREGCVYRLSSKRLPDRGQSHGTGCTLSSALAAALALEMPWKSALCEAKAFVLGSLAEYVEIGPGVPAMYPPVDDRVEQVRLEKL